MILLLALYIKKILNCRVQKETRIFGGVFQNARELHSLYGHSMYAHRRRLLR